MDFGERSVHFAIWPGGLDGCSSCYAPEQHLCHASHLAIARTKWGVMSPLQPRECGHTELTNEAQAN
jgi:hypothetical protein